MRRSLWVALVAASLAIGAVPAIAGAGPTLTTLSPGEKVEVAQELNVNLVFVGYEQGTEAQQIDVAEIESWLPDTYEPINRFPSFYFGPQPTGQEFSFEYKWTWATDDFADEFFGYLTSLKGDDSGPTLFQGWYSDQLSAELEITENYRIDAQSVEGWLADNLGVIDVDTTEYTVVFINWYGRDDFVHHTYVKTDEPDPDTEYNFGIERESRNMIAWGGTLADSQDGPARLWFYDLSAGPHAWTDNWNVDDEDLDGDGVPDYRMPPIWEYGGATEGALPFGSLSEDLGLITRFVAVNLLFTTSPLYRPALSGPALPDSIQIDVNIYQGDPNVNALNFINGPYITEQLDGLRPFNLFETEINNANFNKRARSIYNCFVTDVSCYGKRLFGIAFGDLFLYHDDRILQFTEGDADYELPVFTYNDSEPLAGGGLLGFADDNWTDGTQSYVFTFNDPFLRFLGYGLSDTIVHEAGHHVGMSHPHDGYDSEIGFDYGPGGDLYFAWQGDESSSVMSYISLEHGFSQFDHDNMARFMTLEYLNTANAVLAKLYRSPRVAQVETYLLSADAFAASALAHYDAMDYADGVADAQIAFRTVTEAAAAINVPVEPQAPQADAKAAGVPSGYYVDTVQDKRMSP